MYCLNPCGIDLQTSKLKFEATYILEKYGGMKVVTICVMTLLYTLTQTEKNSH